MAPRRRRSGLAIMAWLVVAGCSAHADNPPSGDSGPIIGSGTGSCRTSPGGIMMCMEYTGPGEALQALRDSCQPTGDVPGTWSMSSCSTSGAAGGCRMTQSGATVTQWAWGLPADAIRMQCATLGGAFVSP